MQLWTYQHPHVLETLQRGETYACQWEWVPGERWRRAFRWMGERMTEAGLSPGEYAPVWAWHSVGRIGGKPDYDCANALLFGYQLAQGLCLLELEAPDHRVLLSGYGPWCALMDNLMDGNDLEPEYLQACFAPQIRPRRGRPPKYFDDIQACLPFIEPSWLQAWEKLDTEKMIKEKEIMQGEYDQINTPENLNDPEKWVKLVEELSLKFDLKGKPHPTLETWRL